MTTNPKICPLLLVAVAAEPMAHCLGDRCAWWHEYINPLTGKRDAGRCALASAADALMDVSLIGISVNNN